MVEYEPKQKKWAKVFVEPSNESKRACKILQQVGYLVNTIPIPGLSEPKARLRDERTGRSVILEGLDEIVAFIKYQTLPQHSYEFLT